jgi:paraquat-inducible protein B
MSKKASKTLIGAFVLGALVLIVAGLVIFGSGKFLTKNVKYVMFFEGSVKGLQVGAPVVFRGVKIGQVTDIGLVVDPKNLSIHIPVYIEIEPGKFLTPSAKIFKPKPYQYYHALIEKGLKARLDMQSYVTGLLQIGLDFYPDKPIRLLGLVKKYPEIPTVPTTMEELAKTIQKLPLKEITEKLDRIMGGLDEIVNSPELKGSIASANQLLKDLDAVARDMDARLEPLATSLTKTSEAARGTLVQAEKTLKMNEGVPGEIASDMKETLKASRSTLEEAQKTMAGFKQIADQNANLGYDMSRTLEQMTALSRSLRSLTDYLERHPEAFIKGKHPSKGE